MSTCAIRRRADAEMSTLVVAAIVLSACSGGEAAQDAVTERTSSPATVASDATSTSAPSETEDEQTTPTSEPDESSETNEPTRAYPWLADLVLLTEPSDDLRPLLAFDANGRPLAASVEATLHP